MEKITPISPYRYFSTPSNKLSLFINDYETPCSSVAWIRVGYIFICVMRETKLYCVKIKHFDLLFSTK